MSRIGRGRIAPRSGWWVNDAPYACLLQFLNARYSAKKTAAAPAVAAMTQSKTRGPKADPKLEGLAPRYIVACRNALLLAHCTANAIDNIPTISNARVPKACPAHVVMKGIVPIPQRPHPQIPSSRFCIASAAARAPAAVV